MNQHQLRNIFLEQLSNFTSSCINNVFFESNYDNKTRENPKKPNEADKLSSCKELASHKEKESAQGLIQRIISHLTNVQLAMP